MSNYYGQNNENGIEILGLDETNAENMEIEKIEVSSVFLVDLLVDGSGSMGEYEQTMREELEHLKKATSESKQADEMLISKTVFNDTIFTGGYVPPADVKTDYSADGMTRLYGAIIDRCQRLQDYMEQLDDNGTKARACMVIFSDGKNNEPPFSEDEVKKAIKKLISKEITIAFVAFGDDAFGIASMIGIKPENVREVSQNESELRKMMNLISKSAISASKNANNGSGSGGFFDV